MSQPVHQETKAEKIYHQAVTNILKRYEKAKSPFDEKRFKAISLAWREYEKAIAPLEFECHNDLADAARAYTKATEKCGGDYDNTRKG